MVWRARRVVTMMGPPLEDGAVVVAGDEIVAVATAEHIRRMYAGEVCDLGEVVLLPGLINAHCHLDYTDMVGQAPWHGSFLDWILRVVELKKNRTEAQFRAAIWSGAQQLIRSGTTTVVNIESFPTLIEPVGLRVVWCPELIDFKRDGEVPVDFAVPNNANSTVVGAVCNRDRRGLPEHCEGRSRLQSASTNPEEVGGLSPHAPYTASAALYRRAAAEARRRGWLLTTHVAESREEDEMLRHGTGPMAEFFGRAAEGVGAVEWLSRWDVLGTNCLAVHANHVTASEVELLAKSGTHVVHCPKSHRFFGREPVMWERWMKCGVNVCLGTDSLASNDSLDMFGEMRAVSGLSPRQVLALATVNAAKALNRDGKLGRIAPGAWADLIAVPVASGTADAHEAVVFAEKPVNFVMIGGKVVVS